MPDAPLNRVLHFLRRSVAPADGTGDGELLRRFVAAREEAAFADLVRRHGAMVFGVCRRVLDDVHDAEDAVQATFLVLARRAAAVRKHDSVASWLYGVAYRVARKARTAAARRPRTGVDLLEPETPADPAAAAAWRELRPVIDEELSRLPEKYRAPLVLCYLEGKTNEEAARLLGCSKGTVSGRLARARDLLRPRLARRGLAPTLAGLAALLAASAAPAALMETTVKAVLAGGIAAPAAALAEGVLRAMFVKKTTTLAAVVLALGLIGGVGLLRQPNPAAAGDGDEEKPAKAKPGVLFTLPEEQKKEPDDLEKLQGEWSAASLEHNGEKLSAEAVRKFRVVIRDDAITFDADGNKREASFMLATSNKPKAIWLKAYPKAEEVRGIYALEDGRLKICIDNDGGKAVPTEFATKAGSGLTLLVLERQQALEGATDEPKAGADKALRTLRESGSPVRGVAFSPDGKSVWAAPEDGRVTVWDVATGKARPALRGDSQKCLTMALSPDGKQFLIGGTTDAVKGGDGREVQAGWISVYTTSFEKAIWSKVDSSGIRAAAFSPDGKQVALGHDNSHVIISDAATGKQLFGFALEWRTRAKAVAFSPDGKAVMAGFANGEILSWDVRTKDQWDFYNDHTGGVTVLRFAPDGRQLLTAGRDGNLLVWDMPTGKERRRLEVSKKVLCAATFSPDGKLIATGDEEGRLVLCEGATGKVLLSFAADKKAVDAVAFSPDGTTVATGGAGGSVKLWSLRK